MARCTSWTCASPSRALPCAPGRVTWRRRFLPEDRFMTIGRILCVLCATAGSIAVAAQPGPAQPDWKAVEEETMRHFQAAVRLDTTAKERPLAEHVKQVLDQNGIPAQLFAQEPDRPNVLARLKGNGSKRPLLIMGHLDT